MKIDRLEVRLLRLPLAHFFETSFGRSYDRTFLLIRVEGEGAGGLGRVPSPKRIPYYSSETTETAWHIITEFLAPRVVGQSFEHPRDAVPGDGAACAATTWPRPASRWQPGTSTRGSSGKPLSAVLGGTRDRIASGVSIGIQDSLDQLVAKVDKELAAGYRRIKIKIKPGWDVNAVEAVRARFPDIRLMVDANAAYSRERRRPPGPARRLPAHDDRAAARLRRRHGPRAVAARDHDADLPRRVDSHRAHRPRRHRRAGLQDHQRQAWAASAATASRSACTISVQEHGIPVWHGGMLESGIGRAHNIHLASLPNFSLPGDIAASKRYYVPDLIEPGIEVSADGTIAVPTGPGIGVNIVEERVNAATLRQVSLDAAAMRSAGH